MIFDCHTHLNRYSPDDAPTLVERCDALLREMDAHRIAGALVLGSYAVNSDRPSLQALLEVTREHPRLGVVAGVRHACVEQDLAEVAAAARKGAIRGLKLYPGYEPFIVNAPSVAGVYALARELALPVMIHTGDTYAAGAQVKLAHPLSVDELAVRHPDVTFVLCHLGNPWFVDAMEVVYKNDNVVADISGLTLGAFEERFERVLVRKLNDVVAYLNDPDKLLFGSDWPISDVGSYLEFVGKLDLTQEEREGLLWANAARVFRLAIGPPKGAPR